MKDTDRVLRLLTGTPCWFPGRDLRELLNRDLWFWQRYRVPDFYALMARLVDVGAVEERFNLWVVGGILMRVPEYRLPQETERGDA